MKTVRRLLVAALIVSAVAMPLLALARHRDPGDGRDTRGPLDVRRIRMSGTERPRYQVITYPRWSAGRIFDRGYGLVYFDTFGDGRFDYYALIRSNGYGLKGLLFRDFRKEKDVRVAKLRVWRPNQRSFVVRVPLRKMKISENRTFYSWYVQTLLIGNRCRRVCFDRVPDDGRVTELVPGYTPPPPVTPIPPPSLPPTPITTPSPSPSPSPTATATAPPTATPSTP